MSNSKELKLKINEYIKYALDKGALHAVCFKRDDIVYDERTLLKCAFGCDDFGHHHTCPSAKTFLGLSAYKRMFKNYSKGIIIHCANKEISQKISFEIESAAFVDGFYWAFSLSDCSLCNECRAKTDMPCPNPKKARPAFHSVGIDVFATVHKFGLPLYTLKDKDGNEQQNWYSAVFIK
jgi:predicted metal-binding protein